MHASAPRAPWRGLPALVLAAGLASVDGVTPVLATVFAAGALGGLCWALLTKVNTLRVIVWHYTGHATRQSRLRR